MSKKSRRRRDGNPQPPIGGTPRGNPPQGLPPGQSFAKTQGNIGSQGQTGGRTTQINKITINGATMMGNYRALLGIGPGGVVTGLQMIGNKVWGDADLINNQGRLENPFLASNELHANPSTPPLSKAERRRRWKEQWKKPKP